ncbi:hypothetical protein MKW92_002881 [Papaver armeniacum]|nr:hypothetical protein MKW92_002881 [Papaver armeniacum]
MMVSRGLFGWSPPHIQPLTPVSEVSEPPESPSPYITENNNNNEGNPQQVSLEDDEDEMDGEDDEMEPPPAAVPFSRLFVYADTFDWFLMVFGSVAAAAHGIALVVYLHFFGKVIHLMSFKGSTSSDQLLQLFQKHTLQIMYIASAVFVAGWIEVSCWILTGERQTAVIRSKYVHVLLNQDMSFFDTYGNNGDIVSQVLSDVLLIQSALSEKVGNYIHNMATFFGGLVIGVINCWQIALLTLATGPFIVAAGGISNIFLHRLAENIQDAYAEAAGIAEQAVSYIRTLYAFTNETLAKYSYATSLQATLRYGILISLVQGLGLGFTYGLAICSCALQLWVGRFLVSHKKAHGGEIVIALFSVILSGLGLNQAATNFYSFEQGRIAAYRLFEMISRSTSSVNHDGNTLASVQGNIEFRNVYFSYLSRPEIPILSGFYLTVPARKTVALVGRNGSGKSSIIPLMERFYDPTLGEVLLDGENIKNLKLEWLRSKIGLVTQEPALLSLSIRDNIAYGRPSATPDQIEEAAKTAHAHTFISSLEKGYETQVGRAGLELTEEQKIKLSVARAVFSNPSILLLDEVTGGLDFEAERAVQEALDVLMLGRSTIIIARRLSLIRNADYIAVMEEGQLVEMGTHDELLALDGLYAELLRCEEAAKLPKRKDASASHSFQEPTSPKMVKSPSLQRTHGYHAFKPTDGTINLEESSKVQSPPSEQMLENGTRSDSAEMAPSMKRQDSFEMRLPELPKIDVHAPPRQSTNTSDPESPISPLLTSDPMNERSHSKTFSRPLSQLNALPLKRKESKDTQNRKNYGSQGFSRGIQEMHRKASLVLEDAVRNIYTVVAFCAGNKVMELYRLQLVRIYKKSFLHGIAIGFAFGLSQFLLFACNAFLLWYTARSVKNGYLDLHTAVKVYMVFSFATFALVEPFGLAPYILKRRKSLASVFEIIDRVPKIDPDDNSGLKPPNVYGSIELKNVDFCYPTRPELMVLSNFNLKISGGQTVAVVGVSGSGKSTIISMIERFYDPVSGQVLLDGRDLKLFNVRWLRNHLGLVQQEPIIFSTTIRENIIYARHNATEAEMKEAARIANAHHFISSLPHGYDTHVGMRGVDLTSGQKQRIAIARVVLKNAPILLLDEASSAIESESSRVVQEALDTLIMGNKTTILIAHRAAMMKHVDNIVVLNGGRIVEQGSHDVLVAKNGLYVQLMQPHFGKGLRQRRFV